LHLGCFSKGGGFSDRDLYRSALIRDGNQVAVPSFCPHSHRPENPQDPTRVRRWSGILCRCTEGGRFPPPPPITGPAATVSKPGENGDRTIVGQGKLHDQGRDLGLRRRLLHNVVFRTISSPAHRNRTRFRSIFSLRMNTMNVRSILSISAMAFGTGHCCQVSIAQRKSLFF